MAGLTLASLCAASVGACTFDGGQTAKDDTAKYFIENGDFETGDLSGWTVLSGRAFTAFGVTDEYADSLSQDYTVPYGKQGRYLYGRYKEQATGTMISSTFTVGGSGYISFKMGGGYLGALNYISIVDASSDEELARYENEKFNLTDYSTDRENYRGSNLVQYVADLSGIKGRQVRIKVVDDSTANWGFMTLDDFVTYYEQKPSFSDAFAATDVKPTFSELKATPNNLYNGDFSEGLGGWTLSGEENCFTSAQIKNGRLSNKSSENSVGVLRSSAFKVGGQGLISFRLGATKNKTLTYLTVKKVGTNEEVLRTYSNRWKEEHDENTHLYFADLSKYKGERLYIEIVDNSRGDWGFVSIESVNTLYTALPKVTDEIAVNINEPIATDYSYSVMRNLVDSAIAGIADETERLTLNKTFYATIDGVSNKKGNWGSVLKYNADGTTFCYTGDIHAMWLRDSSAQVLPYLQFMNADKDVKAMVKGLIRKQFEQIRRDPYANAFNPDGSTFERKFEIDSLCYPVWLAYNYYEITGDDSVFDAFFKMTVGVIMDTFKAEQNHSDANYRISNENDRSVGSHTFNPNCKLIWSGYRPSDDVCYYKYFIPGNMFAVATLERINDVFTNVYPDAAIATRAKNMADEVRTAIETYGVYEHPTFGKIYAFEVTGETADKSSQSGKLLMDAANIPSLISAPWLGYCEPTDETYLNTRAYALSDDNPYYYVGRYASGIGDPHDMVASNSNPHKDKPVPWHMSIAMQALTSTDQAEVVRCVKYMTDTTAGTYVMHEAFYADDPNNYSRDFFTWPCALYAHVYITRILGINMI